VFLRIIISIFLFLAWGAVFNSVCAAGPVMVEKNLFSLDRKAPPPESADASAKPSKASMEIANLQLDGVIIDSKAKKALLRMKNQPAGTPGKKGQPSSPFITVREGQSVSDYRVSKIDSRSISLEKDGQTFTIGLFAENKVVSPSSPVAPVQQPVPAPVAAPPGGNQPPSAEASPQNQPQVTPGQAQMPQGTPVAPGGRFPGLGRNIQQNPNAPAPESPANQDPNQPAEIIEEQE